MKPLFALALVALIAAGGCRGALGIGELDLPEDDSEGAGGSGAGRASATGGSASAGETNGAGPKGKAGASSSGAGGTGAQGEGGGASTGPAPAKSCPEACAEKSGKKGLEEYYAGAKGCACDDDDPTSCSAACGGNCDVKPSELASAPAGCVACIAQKTRSPACEGELSECDKECAAFRVCVEACPN